VSNAAMGVRILVSLSSMLVTAAGTIHVPRFAASSQTREAGECFANSETGEAGSSAADPEIATRMSSPQRVGDSV
jgi:hypothetical protein